MNNFSHLRAIQKSFTKNFIAMKELHCKDLGFDCPAVVKAESESDVLQIAAQHAREVHQVTVTPEMAEQIKPLIHDV
ncbi:hypothetical protein GCM10028774_09700 [Spirosoma jeollabukense]